MKKLFYLLFTFTMLTAGCAKLDVVADFAEKSFKNLTSALDKNISFDENYWILKTESGDKLKISKSINSDQKKIILDIDAKPFIDAGLAIDKLPSSVYDYNKNEKRINIFSQNSDFKKNYKESSSINDALKNIINAKRSLISYHEALDHYGLMVTDGNVFEWAKNISTNDKDIVFVLNPLPIIEAGVNPEKVEGWIYTDVEMKNNKGEKIKIKKFLKPYNLNLNILTNG